MIAEILRVIGRRCFSPSRYLECLVHERTKGRVHSGPFAGMKFADGVTERLNLPNLLGTYEKELNPFIEKACELNFRHIVVVGAADGYYAVGMSLRNPQAQVIAFERDSDSQCKLTRMATTNGVQSRIEIRGQCEPEDLQAVLANASRALVICDTEGYESALIDLVRVPALHRAWILVELHEFVERGIAEKIEKRFAATHNMSRIWQENRTAADFPFNNLAMRCLPRSYLHWAVNESRPEQMSWFWMGPRRINGSD